MVIGMLFASVLMPALTNAQPSSCDLGSVSEARAATYPVIAKAAHVQGTVVMLATFALDGAVTNVVLVSGPEMLRAIASLTATAISCSEPRYRSVV